MTDTISLLGPTGSHDGSCACGRLRFRLIGAPQAVNCCHCRDCQRLTGSTFAVNAVYPASQVELGANWSERDLQLSPDGARSWRCSGCGVLLMTDHRAFRDLRFIPVGTLEKGEQFSPDTHYFVRSKHPWVVIPEGITAWEAMPPSDPA